jgi:hypothetical protein
VVQRSRHVYVSLFLLGLISGAIAIAVSLYLRTFSGAIFIPELASIAISYVAILIVSFVLIAIADITIQSVSTQELVINLIPPQIAFGITSAYFYRNIEPRALRVTREEGIASPDASSGSIPGIDQNRRLIIKAGIASIIVVPLLYLGLNYLLFPREGAQSRLPLRLKSHLNRDQLDLRTQGLPRY